jgi:multicomponent Na+:H+ antiporter subunit A
LKLADWITLAMQDGNLRHYLLWIMGTLVLLVGGALLRGKTAVVPSQALIPGPNEILLALVILGATWMVVRANSRLAAVAGLGVIGYSMALIFILYGAPDLAMTQFSVETLTVILFVLVLYKLPTFDTQDITATRLRNVVVSLLVGVVMTGLVLAANAIPASLHVTNYYSENSYLLAKGHNIVNVILVDFRGLDTMVEIMVLSVAAVGVYALLHTSKKGLTAVEEQEGES